MIPQETLVDWEKMFPGIASTVVEVVDPVRNPKQFYLLNPPAADLFAQPAREIPWKQRGQAKVLDPKDLHGLVDLRIKYTLYAEELIILYRDDIAPRLGDERAQGLLSCLSQTLDSFHLQQADLLKNLGLGTSIYLAGGQHDEELLGVTVLLQLRHDILRNVFKFCLLTLAGSILEDPHYDCRLALERCRNGNLLYGEDKRTEEVVYFCDRSSL